MTRGAWGRARRQAVAERCRQHTEPLSEEGRSARPESGCGCFAAAYGLDGCCLMGEDRGDQEGTGVRRRSIQRVNHQALVGGMFELAGRLVTVGGIEVRLRMREGMQLRGAA
jgi:hypothetical protein